MIHKLGGLCMLPMFSPHVFIPGFASAEGAGSGATQATADIDPVPIQADPPTYQQILDALVVAGYPDRVSVFPGESVDFKVSTTAAEFSSQLVRIRHGDSDPRGPGIREDVISTERNGPHKGKHQLLPVGSYITVPTSKDLDLSGSFSIVAWIAPTTVPGSKLNTHAQHRTPAGTPRIQGIVSKWDPSTETGYGLYIEDDGSLGLRIGGSKQQAFSTGVALNAWKPAQETIPLMAGYTNWYFVAATFDATSGTVTLYQEPLNKAPDPTRITRSGTIVGAPGTNDVPLLIAAGWEQKDDPIKAGLFNGKIDNPAIYDRALTAEEVRAILKDQPAPKGRVAAWDFAKGLGSGTADVHDPVGGNDGVAINSPLRAATGHLWRDGVFDYKSSPEAYTGIYFHEDDIIDAKWETSFAYKIPEDALSGIYAARLTAGDAVYYATFVVKPRPGRESKIAFLVSTFTYLAYSVHGSDSSSLYGEHRDGSPNIYSSWNRPIPALAPDGKIAMRSSSAWGLDADTHLTDWLEGMGYDVSYITDHDLHTGGAELLKSYKAVLTGTHPEYISDQEWKALDTWLSSGGRLMYMGGNGFYWVTSLDPSGNYIEVRRHHGTRTCEMPPGEYYHSTTGEFGGTWRYRGRAPNELVGVGFTAQGAFATYGRPYDVLPDGRSPAGSWVFEGVDVSKPIGAFVNLQQFAEGRYGPAGEEIDRADVAIGTPATTLVLAEAKGWDDEMIHVVEEVLKNSLDHGGSINPLVKADMTLMYYPNGGAVWSSSSISWAGSLHYNGYDNEISRITKNVLDKFASGEDLPGSPADSC